MSEQVAAQDKPKERLVEQMPGDILNNGSVSCEDRLGVNDLVLLGGSIDVPQADGVVVTG